LRCGGKIFKRRRLRSILGLIRYDRKKRGTMNRFPAWLCIPLLISSCSSGSSQTATLILDNPTWDRVNVEAVITNSADCDNRGKEYVETKEFVMTKGQTMKIQAPKGESICWRHDRNPNNPAPGAWSGWSRAPLAPGQTAETDL
jgi:hypothetical protein